MQKDSPNAACSMPSHITGATRGPTLTEISYALLEITNQANITFTARSPVQNPVQVLSLPHLVRTRLVFAETVTFNNDNYIT